MKLKIYFINEYVVFLQSYVPVRCFNLKDMLVLMCIGIFRLQACIAKYLLIHRDMEKRGSFIHSPVALLQHKLRSNLKHFTYHDPVWHSSRESRCPI